MAMGGLDPKRTTAENYRVFGREARGRSPAYETLAAAVAGDDLILEFLSTLPPPKRQPNLLFAAARYLGPPSDVAALPGPLALIEVGASAGLTLLFDHYSYDYDGHQIVGCDPDAPTLRCAISGPAPLPDRVPAIAWRAGLDLNPLDVTHEDD